MVFLPSKTSEPFRNSEYALAAFNPNPPVHQLRHLRCDEGAMAGMEVGNARESSCSQIRKTRQPFFLKT
jgi:hypothetical protein